MVGGIIFGALLALWVSSVSELAAQPLVNVSTAPITILAGDRTWAFQASTESERARLPTAY